MQQRGAREMKIQLKVQGMHCKSCEILLKDALEEIPEVKVLRTDHKKGIIEVNFNEKKINIEQLREAVKKEGYSVQG